MLGSRTKVLLVLPQGVFDRARIFAGNATIALKLPVSLQIVLRALIEEGLKRRGDAAIFANVEGQARAVRHIRRRRVRDLNHLGEHQHAHGIGDVGGRR
jgi:hypothetical protein